MKTYLDPRDVELMEKRAGSARDKLLIRLLFRLGCRVSEAIAITVSDVDFERTTITILHLRIGYYDAPARGATGSLDSLNPKHRGIEMKLY